jgi:hypothetical protein
MVNRKLNNTREKIRTKHRKSEISGIEDEDAFDGN